jgi:hypothetical protein
MNIAQAIKHLFPNADPMRDFIVRDDGDGNGPYIDPAAWKIDAPIPTPEELQAGWEAYQAAEAAKPQPVTTEMRIADLETENITLMLALTEVYEEKEVEKAALEQESINNMLAITELYEMNLMLQAQLEALQTGGN